MAETQVSIRIDLESGWRIGPGKIALLRTGSITVVCLSNEDVLSPSVPTSG